MDDYLHSVREQLRARTERAARRRPATPAGGPPGGRRRRRRVLLDVGALATVVSVAAAVLAIALTAGTGTPAQRNGKDLTAHGARRASSTASKGPVSARGAARDSGAGQAPGAPAPASPAGGPVPAGFSPESFTAIGQLTWWLLGSAPCSSPPCTSIVRTEDGGRTFAGIPAPRTDGVSQLRFADARDGFAYGPQLWTTHDGGQTWRQVSLGGAVSDLETSGGYVYAIVRTAGGHGTLMRSPISTDSFSALSAAGGVLGARRGLWAQAAAVLVVRASPTGVLSGMLASSDDGQAFASDPLPPAIACDLQEPQPPVVWEDCSTGMLSGVWRSTDGGATFASADSPTSGLPSLPNCAAFAAASVNVAVTGYRRLYRTANGGARWSAVAGLPTLHWSYLGFTDPTHGVAIGEPLSGSGPAQLYYTTDGGASYHPVAIR